MKIIPFFSFHVKEMAKFDSIPSGATIELQLKFTISTRNEMPGLMVSLHSNQKPAVIKKEEKIIIELVPLKKDRKIIANLNEGKIFG